MLPIVTDLKLNIPVIALCYQTNHTSYYIRVGCKLMPTTLYDQEP